MNPEPAQRPNAATASERMKGALAAASEDRTDLVSIPEPRPPMPPDPGTAPYPAAAGFGPSPNQREEPPGQPWPGSPPPAGLSHNPWSPGPTPTASTPARRSTGRRLPLIATALVAVLALIAAVLLTERALLGHWPTASKSLIGDPRTADPCSLLSVESVQSLGQTSLIPDFISPQMCGLEIIVAPGYVHLTAEIAAPYALTPPGQPEQIRDLNVFRQPADHNACHRTIVLPDQLWVYISTYEYKGATVDLCRFADIATTTSVNALTQNAVARRARPDPPNALTTVDLCSVIDQAALEPVSGLNTSRLTPGLNGWRCDWGRNPTYPFAPLVIAEVSRPWNFPAGNAEIAGRAAVVQPNTDTRVPPQSCTIYLTHRKLTANDGSARVEALRLTVYAGIQPNPDLACAQARAVLTNVAPKLPSAS